MGLACDQRVTGPTGRACRPTTNRLTRPARRGAARGAGSIRASLVGEAPADQTDPAGVHRSGIDARVPDGTCARRWALRPSSATCRREMIVRVW